jgi:hypothetical protein
MLNNKKKETELEPSIATLIHFVTLKNLVSFGVY